MKEHHCMGCGLFACNQKKIQIAALILKKTFSLIFRPKICSDNILCFECNWLGVFNAPGLFQ
jgi:hypothetical protein